MLYVQATHTGKGFITHEDRTNFNIQCVYNNIWKVEDNSEGNLWITRVNGNIKTKEEAQTIIRNLQVDTFEPTVAKPAITEPDLMVLT